eukprot:gene11034-11189_t
MYTKLLRVNAQTRAGNLKPLAFVQPSSTEGVSAAVNCAVSAGVPFVARNGGHSYEGNSLVLNGLVIDLSRLTDIQLLLKDKILAVGGGTRLGPVYRLLLRHNMVLPGGVCVGVGISGSTLGGGLHLATRALGLTADSVLAATVVLANGTVVAASNQENADLFWAIRGGGPLYGIVTSWTFQVYT